MADMGSSLPDPDTALAGQIAALARRLTALEDRLNSDGDGGRDGVAGPGDGGGAPEAAGRADLPDTYWALARLRHEIAELAEPQGGVMVTGSVSVRPGQGPAEWQNFTSVSSLLDADLPRLAETLGALGQPVRLRLIPALLEGRSTVAELVELDGLGTTGQIYHHLRQLVAAGWRASTGRGRYEIPAARLVPLLAALAAAHR